MELGSKFTLSQYQEACEACSKLKAIIKELENENGERVFTLVQNPDFTDLEKYITEKNNLTNWFDSVYTYKEQKYRRLIALNKLDDDGIDGQTKLTALYEEAEEKRARIQELELLLNN